MHLQRALLPLCFLALQPSMLLLGSGFFAGGSFGLSRLWFPFVHCVLAMHRAFSRLQLSLLLLCP